MLLGSKKSHHLHHKRSVDTDHRPAVATAMAAETHDRKPVAAAPATKLSLFVGLAESFSSSSSSSSPTESFPRSPTPRSPRNFDDGAVGLGIVAAMNESGDGGGGDAAQIARTPRSAVPTRSEPIPIVSVGPAARIRGKARREAEEEKEQEEGAEEEMEMEEELSESYTCVISHVGGKSVRKRVYLDDGGAPGGVAGSYWGNSELFFASPPPAKPVLPAADFLSRCYLCRKKLRGLDIFMYRGDRAFCSVECRCQQIVSDELREKCVSDAVKPFDCCSVSPCSTPLIFAAGVTAA